MSRKSKLLIIMFLSVLLVFNVFGCGQNGEINDGQEETIFIIARTNDADTLDAPYGYSDGEIDLMYHIYEGLLTYLDDDLNLGPSLAINWYSSEDEKTWTFELREGVKFHDGTDFNADAVVFSFERFLQEDHPYADVGQWSYADYLLGDVIASVKAVDEYTVEFTLNEVFAPFLTYLGLYATYIVSPTAVQEYGLDAYHRNPVGTGPYIIDDWVGDSHISMVYFDDYWGEKQIIDKIIWKVVPDATTRMLELQAGDVHAIKTFLPDQLEILKADPNITVGRLSGANCFFGEINHDAEPFDDVRMRQALMHAIDFDKLVDSVYEGLGTRAINPMPPTMFGYNHDIKPYAYDPDIAKELMVEAGYPDGYDLDIHIFSGARVYIGRPVDVAEIIAADLRAVGINANVIVNEWATHLSVINQRQHQIAIHGWYDVPHPNNFMRTMMLEGLVGNGYSPQILWDLANMANETYDRDLQEQYYREMQEIIHKDVGFMPIAHSDYTWALAENVVGFKMDILGNIHLIGAYFK